MSLSKSLKIGLEIIKNPIDPQEEIRNFQQKFSPKEKTQHKQYQKSILAIKTSKEWLILFYDGKIIREQESLAFENTIAGEIDKDNFDRVKIIHRIVKLFNHEITISQDYPEKFTLAIKDDNKKKNDFLKQLKNSKNQISAIYYSIYRGSHLAKFISIRNDDSLILRNFNILKTAEYWEKEEVISKEKSIPSKTNLVVKNAIQSFLDNIDDVFLEDLDPKQKSGSRLLLNKNSVIISIEQLSDGEKNILSLITDLARRLAINNPELHDPIEEGKSIVLLDELDLHLHPQWQRRIVEKLKEIFKNCQFIVTSHSPFIIQSIEPGELILLDKEIETEYANQGLEEIARFIMGIDSPEMSQRYKEMKDVAEEYYRLLENAQSVSSERKEELKQKLIKLTNPYMNNPAYSAYIDYLEQKKMAKGL